MANNIAELLHEKELLTSRLSKLLYGAVEIREKNEKKYIYVHYREDGVKQSKYAGELSNELYNLIIENNNLAKEYKKRIKIVTKQLGLLSYEKYEISDNVKVNIDLARRNLVDSIYKQAMLEGVATTYSDTETIIKGGKVKDMSLVDISKVVNLKRSWEFIMSEGVISYPTNFTLLCQINAIVEDGFSYTAGRLRAVPVSIGGSTYIPPMPLETKVKEDLMTIVNSESNVIEITIDLLLYVMKSQLFLGGNKRTAVIFANHFMISKGYGLIVVPAELVSEYKRHLIHYYEGKNNEIRMFLKEKCLIIIK
ncbi:MAG: Fic family protein [Vulcanibacillus sp.]